jgi:hypothetical protein
MIMAKRSPLAEKLHIVRERIAAAAEKAKRDPSEITLIAVTKTAAPEQVREILQLGVADLGESRVQVLTQRTAQVNEFVRRNAQGEAGGVPERIRWHMIGHLQRNKVKPVLSGGPHDSEHRQPAPGRGTGYPVRQTGKKIAGHVAGQRQRGSAKIRHCRRSGTCIWPSKSIRCPIFSSPD